MIFFKKKSIYGANTQDLKRKSHTEPLKKVLSPLVPNILSTNVKVWSTILTRIDIKLYQKVLFCQIKGI